MNSINYKSIIIGCSTIDIDNFNEEINSLTIEIGYSLHNKYFFLWQDHDVPEVVQVSLIVRSADEIFPLATSQFEYRQDQSQYAAEFLLFSTISQNASEFLATLSPELIGLTNTDIAEFDSRLVTGLKLTNTLTRSWSILNQNSDEKSISSKIDNILHISSINNVITML